MSRIPSVKLTEKELKYVLSLVQAADDRTWQFHAKSLVPEAKKPNGEDYTKADTNILRDHITFIGTVLAKLRDKNDEIESKKIQGIEAEINGTDLE